VGKNVDDLEDVLFGDAEPVRHVRYLHELVSGQGAIDQNADRVAGLLRQAHIGLPEPRGRG
jgi:hypothetical protein